MPLQVALVRRDVQPIEGILEEDGFMDAQFVGPLTSDLPVVKLPIDKHSGNVGEPVRPRQANELVEVFGEGELLTIRIGLEHLPAPHD